MNPITAIFAGQDEPIRRASHPIEAPKKLPTALRSANLEFASTRSLSELTNFGTTALFATE